MAEEEMLIRDRQLIEKKAQKVKLLLVNCEGVLTDSSIFIMENGEELRRFSVKDIFGLTMLSEHTGINILLVSEERNTSFTNFAAKFKLEDRFLGFKNKEFIVDQINKDYKIEADQVAYIGCELDDLAPMNIAGFSICPLDSAYEIINSADYVCNSCGGSGVIREIADMIIMAKTTLDLISKQS
ncbi:MAG: hypothetical protein R6U11_10765 [Bacteroidales bacterium]